MLDMQSKKGCVRQAMIALDLLRSNVADDVDGWFDIS
jgi:hypothetical protein